MCSTWPVKQIELANFNDMDGNFVAALRMMTMLIHVRLFQGCREAYAPRPSHFVTEQNTDKNCRAGMENDKLEKVCTN